MVGKWDTIQVLISGHLEILDINCLLLKMDIYQECEFPQINKEKLYI